MLRRADPWRAHAQAGQMTSIVYSWHARSPPLWEPPCPSVFSCARTRKTPALHCCGQTDHERAQTQTEKMRSIFYSCHVRSRPHVLLTRAHPPFFFSSSAATSRQFENLQVGEDGEGTVGRRLDGMHACSSRLFFPSFAFAACPCHPVNQWKGKGV